MYEQISSHISIDSRYRGAWPRVKQFVQELEPGSVVCDVGCGNGKYLNINPDIFVVGSDRCMSLAQTAREKDFEVSRCFNKYTFVSQSKYYKLHGQRRAPS